MQNWYAVKLRFIVLLETTGSEEANDSICLLRGDSFAAAFARALRIGTMPRSNTSAAPVSVSADD